MQPVEVSEGRLYSSVDYHICCIVIIIGRIYNQQEKTGILGFYVASDDLIQENYTKIKWWTYIDSVELAVHLVWIYKSIKKSNPYKPLE